MIEATRDSMAARKGTSSTRVDPVGRMLDQRQLEMRVGAGVAVAGEMLAAGGDAILLQVVDEHLAEARHLFGRVGERAITDHGILRVRVDIEHGRVIE